MINNEIKINNTDQYSRRNNIVIQGMPQSIKYKDLEYKVITVLHKVNVKATKSDIEACYRLGDSRKTIVRFVNRKHSFEALKNKIKKCLCMLILPLLRAQAKKTDRFNVGISRESFYQNPR